MLILRTAVVLVTMHCNVRMRCVYDTTCSSICTVCMYLYIYILHIPACCYARRLSATRTLHTAGPVSISPHQTKQHYKVRLFDRHTHISNTAHWTLDIIHRHYYAPCTIMFNTCYNTAASDNIALKHNQLSQMKHQLLQRPPPTALSLHIYIYTYSLSLFAGQPKRMHIPNRQPVSYILLITPMCQLYA
jgi:hypothetical protein